jgi:UDP-N-acetylmuramoyl-L-alanyl-D-glutamate--2,6-diaminopimelate ligase
VRLRRVLKGTGVRVPKQLSETEVTHVTNDSREVGKGSLFVAVRGFRTDGHRFIDAALEAGAAACVAEAETAGRPAVLPNPSGDNRHLLAVASANLYRNPWEELTMVGITGTNGKTSTAMMLASILESTGIMTGVLGTLGYRIADRTLPAPVTTPESHRLARLLRRMADSGCGACVMEVSSHALALSRVDMVGLDAAVFTNISQDHLDFHADMEEYLRAKLRIFDLLKPGGSALVGTYAPGAPRVEGAVTFGDSESDDYRVRGKEVHLGRISYRLGHGGREVGVEVPVSGSVNVYNSAGALAAAHCLGLDLEEAAGGLRGFGGVPGRLEAVDEGQDFLVAVDYAHTPDALEKVLQQAGEMSRGRVIAVFGAGGDRDRGKRPRMGAIADRLSDVMVLTSDNPRTEDPEAIIRDVLEGVGRDDELHVEPDRRRAIRLAVDLARSGDVVVIAGKGHEDYQILGRERVHFDDREEARKALVGRLHG